MRKFPGYKSLAEVKDDLVLFEREFQRISKTYGKHTEKYKHAQANVSGLKYLIKHWDRLSKGVKIHASLEKQKAG